MRKAGCLTIIVALVIPLGVRASELDDSPLISLAESLDPLRDGFNRARDKPRVVAILSPT